MTVTTATATPAASPSELSLDLIITCADGLETPLQTELTSFGIASDIKSTGRLAVTGTLRDLYTICLWSRVASRVLMLIKRRNINAEYDVAEQIFGLAKSVNWTEQFNFEQTFAIRLSVDKRVAVSQQFAMLRIKDAVADTFNEVYDSRLMSTVKIQIFPFCDGKRQTSRVVFGFVRNQFASPWLPCGND